MNTYIVSTVNNFKKMGTNHTRITDTSISFEFDGKKHILHKGFYALWTLNMAFVGIVSSDFFKANFKVGGMAETKITLKDGSEKVFKLGVFAFLKTNDAKYDV